MPDIFRVKLGNDPKIIEIHTSDRQTFKRCRRRFEWGSTLRQNLIRLGPDQANFFLGSGFHFAMEDFHGLRRFEHPALAFAAYFDAVKAMDRPDEADDLLDLATGMLVYYADEWLEEHPEPYETLMVDSVPQVEVEVAIDITELVREKVCGDDPKWSSCGWWDEYVGDRSIQYITTFDRVVIDSHERIFGLDYKTAANFDELNLQTNPQAGSYDWSTNLFYAPMGYKVEGMVWQQHKKAVPVAPQLVNVGKKNEGFSKDIRQQTTFRIYKRAVVEKYGRVTEDYVDILSKLGVTQDEDGDRYVRRDVLRRNDEQRRNVQDQIIDEVIEMLDRDLPIYPNFTKDCSWDCPFKAPCLAVEDGADFQHMLDNEYTPWQGYRDDWRSRVKYPEAVAATSTP